jgi:hypothetical protein
MSLTVILFLILFGMIALNLWRMMMNGEISGFSAQTRREKIRLYWVIVAAINFVAFLVHAWIDHGGIAFPGGGRLVDGVYHVTQHGRDYSFTPVRYFFSILHGVVFVVVHLVCTVAIWRLRKPGNLTDDKPSA